MWYSTLICRKGIPLHVHKQDECSGMDFVSIFLVFIELKIPTGKLISSPLHITCCTGMVEDRPVQMDPNCVHACPDLASNTLWI